MNEQRIMEQVDAMVASGRITPDEADLLRAARATGEFEAVIAGIRAWHAGVHTAAAVTEGRMSEEWAGALLERVRAGEHTRELRSDIKGLR